ncbi:MAG TPA: hypothetical protein VFG93_00550 [Gaiellaceae bacterium]|nr:hypothetical protein [Gaiellaceae bacterium]
MSPASADWEWLVDGYRRALARFAETAGQRERKERFIPLFEALNWAVAIMDYEPMLWKDEIVLGLRFARNRVHHQLAEALEPRDVPRAEVTTAVRGQSRRVGPPTVLDWFWKAADQLPEPEERFRDKGYHRGKRAYQELLEGNPVEDALAHLNVLL